VTALAPAALRPLRWLGGPSEFGLMLPDASPSPSTMYAPRGVCVTPEAVIVADTGNHRVLVWNEAVPGEDHQDADMVIGQPDMVSEGPKLFFLPTGLLVDGGRLAVADAWHHRILVWDDLATAGSRPPSFVLGQDDLDGVDEGCGPQRFYWPFGVAMVDGAFFVADTGNRRVLGWSGGIPEQGLAPDVVLGQPDLESRGENRDGPVGPKSLRWPHALTSAGGHLIVADAGNHRVLGWRQPFSTDPSADVVLGQPDLTSSFESPYRTQGPSSYRFPYAVTSSDNGMLFIADTSNNRVGILDDAARTFAERPWGAPFDRVVGQDDLDANGENRWKRVESDSLCWPYGISWSAGRLGVADSGNNRVMLWGESG
jgi:hypothetical protein